MRDCLDRLARGRVCGGLSWPCSLMWESTVQRKRFWMNESLVSMAWFIARPYLKQVQSSGCWYLVDMVIRGYAGHRGSHQPEPSNRECSISGLHMFSAASVCLCACGVYITKWFCAVHCIGTCTCESGLAHISHPGSLMVNDVLSF